MFVAAGPTINYTNFKISIRGRAQFIIDVQSVNKLYKYYNTDYLTTSSRNLYQSKQRDLIVSMPQYQVLF